MNAAGDDDGCAIARQYRIEDRLQQDVGRARARELRLDEAAVRASTARNQLRGQRPMAGPRALAVDLNMAKMVASA